MNQSFQRIIDLGTTETAIEPGWCFIGDDNAVPDRHMPNVICAGEIAMHPIQCGGLGCTQMCPAILDLIPI